MERILTGSLNGSFYFEHAIHGLLYLRFSFCIWRWYVYFRRLANSIKLTHYSCGGYIIIPGKFIQIRIAFADSLLGMRLRRLRTTMFLIETFRFDIIL